MNKNKTEQQSHTILKLPFIFPIVLDDGKSKGCAGYIVSSLLKLFVRK